ncbi:MAG: HD domain-containing protein [Desulfatitalea sp.]|nr:HD domain-containing protein [Desulfatitalea sp.]
MPTQPSSIPADTPPAVENRCAAGDRDLVATIRDAARACFADARGSHDWDHTLRVHALCLRIGPKEGADIVVLEAAAYLHDIGRAAQDAAHGSVCHARQGAERARSLLAPLALDEARKVNIVHCVHAHRFRDGNAPATVEARVLFDADKLDAIGAVGVARAYLFAGELGARLHNPGLSPEAARPYSRDDTGHREFVVKLRTIKDRMLTTEGRRLALERHAFMVSFFERFIREYDGHC